MAVALDIRFVRVRISPGTGRFEITDKRARVTWGSDPLQPHFGEATLRLGGQQRRVTLDRCEVARAGDGLEATFHPLADQPAAALRLRFRPQGDGSAVECTYEADPALNLESIRLLDDTLRVTDTDAGYALVPVREGLLVPADSGVAFTHRFDTYAYEGCHLAMFGMVKGGAAALVT